MLSSSFHNCRPSASFLDRKILILKFQYIIHGFDYIVFFFFLIYRILALRKDSVASLDINEFIRRQKVQGTEAYHSESVLDKSITQGKVECSVKVYPTDCLSNVSANVEII